MNTTSSSSHKKRPREANKENHTAQASTSTSTSKKPRISTNVYKTLPPLTTELIELRFQLTEYKGVSRVIQVPKNYTLANLHKLIQYTFGWSETHTHRMYVHTHIDMYSQSYKPGCIKGYGGAPIYEVVPKGQSESLADSDVETRLEDQEITLKEIWNQDMNLNVSNGRCINGEIGIIYEYHSNSTCLSIHITHTDFYKVNIPTCSVVVVNAKGAPPTEDSHEVAPDELSPAHKTVSCWIFRRETFELYCRGEVHSQTQKESLIIYDTEKGIKAAEDKRKARQELRALLIKQKEEKAKEEKKQAEQERKELEKAARRERERQERKESERRERRLERHRERDLEKQREAEMIAFAATMTDEEGEMSNEDAEALIIAVATGLMPPYAAVLLLPKFAVEG